jgi:hypothetical protein
MSKWITFIPWPQPPDAKTKRWAVVAKEGGHKLGDIRWYGPWRQYTFQPVAHTVFERQCLRDLADFCDNETLAHFRLARLAKAAAKQLAPP